MIQLEPCAFEEASHVLVEREKFNRLTPSRLYEIRTKAEENRSSYHPDDPYKPITNSYIIDDFGKEFEGFITIRGIYYKQAFLTTS